MWRSRIQAFVPREAALRPVRDHGPAHSVGITRSCARVHSCEDSDMRSCLLALLVAAMIAAPPPALAAWPHSPFTNLPLCTAAYEQGGASIVSDGAGGAIVTWSDYRNGTHYDVYAHHVLASGAVDPAWPADGRAICTAANVQDSPTIVSDGAGGAIVAWLD